MTTETGIVVIGGGHAGVPAADRLFTVAHEA